MRRLRLAVCCRDGNAAKEGKGRKRGGNGEETGRKRGGNGEETGRKGGGKEEERGRKGEGKGDGVVEGANMMKMNQQEEMMKGERNSRNWIFILVSAG